MTGHVAFPLHYFLQQQRGRQQQQQQQQQRVKSTSFLSMSMSSSSNTVTFASCDNQTVLDFLRAHDATSSGPPVSPLPAFPRPSSGPHCLSGVLRRPR